MSKMTDPKEKAGPLRAPDVPAEEGIESAQVSEDLEESPEEKENATDDDR